MYSMKQTTNSTKEYANKIDLVRFLVNEAERLVIGIGSGMSAAGGLDYTDPELVHRWYPEYYSMGVRGIYEMLGRFWWLHCSKPEAYWGVWARHIWHMRYEAAATEPYLHLRTLVGNKPYFICSTNVDGQLLKAGFSADRIFAPQGEYRYFQCSKPCSDTLYDNEEMIRKMVSNMPSPLEIRTEDIPICPKCGRYLVPNLRCDGSFVEKPHTENVGAYTSFLEGSKQKRTVFLELGVGYNTPGIIRYPFEEFVGWHKKSTLVRVNAGDAGITPSLAARSVDLPYDLSIVMKDLTEEEDCNE